MLRDRLIRRLAAFVAAVAVATASSLAQAQDTKVSFQLDWRFEGPAALFLLAKAKGYFAAEKLDVTIDAGNGSGNAVNRVASGTYQMGFADLAALIEFVGNNPTAPNKPVAVMMVYDDTPAAVFALKKAGITKPADLVGRKMGAPVFDAGRRAFPIFAKANGIDAAKVNWTAMDPPLRETMLAKGDVDAITGFYFTSLLNLNARGVKDEDIVVLPYPKYGVKLYGNAIIVSETFLKEKPEAVKGIPPRVREGCQGRARRPGRLDQVRQGARRADRRGAGEAAIEARDRERHRDAGGQGRRHRRSQPGAPRRHGDAGLFGVRAQEPGQGRRDLQHRVPAAEGGAHGVPEVTAARAGAGLRLRWGTAVRLRRAAPRACAGMAGTEVER